MASYKWSQWYTCNAKRMWKHCIPSSWLIKCVCFFSRSLSRRVVMQGYQVLNAWKKSKYPMNPDNSYMFIYIYIFFVFCLDRWRKDMHRSNLQNVRREFINQNLWYEGDLSIMEDKRQQDHLGKHSRHQKDAPCLDTRCPTKFQVCNKSRKTPQLPSLKQTQPWK